MPLFTSPLPQPPTGPRRKVKYAYWYDSIIEWLLANPSGSVADCARSMNRSPQTLYLIVNSDIFKTRYEQRRQEHFKSLSDGILLKTAKVASKSLDLLYERMEENPEKISTNQLAEVSSSALERLGYGQKAPQTSVTVNAQPQVAVTVSADILSDARERMRQVQKLNAAENPSARQLDLKELAPPPEEPDSFEDVLDLKVIGGE